MPRAATTRRPAALLVITGLTLNACVLTLLYVQHLPVNNDFIGLWSYPRFAPVGDIYNATAIMHFQQALYPDFHSLYPFTYPPDMLLALVPLRLLPFGQAWLVWSLLGIAALALALRPLFGARSWPVLAALLGSPAALIALELGQTSLLASALLLAGLGLLPRRPLLAGILFGLLTLKPQMGILLPFLLARGEGKAITTAALTTAALVAFSCVALPPALWPRWATSLPQIQRDYFASGLSLAPMVSPAATLVRLGLKLPMADAVQTAFFVAIVAVLVLASRRAPYRLVVALLLTGTFIAQPHAYAYDTVALTAALALWFETPPSPGALALAALLYVAPLMLLTAAAPWFLYALPLTIFFALLARAALKAENSVP
jgi:hypothetical protein